MNSIAESLISEQYTQQYQFKMDGISYFQMKDPNDNTLLLEKFLSSYYADNCKPLTVNQLLQRHYPKLWRNNKKIILMPRIVNELSLSTRVRILRIAESYLFQNELIRDEKLFNFLEHMRSCYCSDNLVGRELSYCYFATRDNPLAAHSLFVNNGPAIQRRNIKDIACSDLSSVKIDFSDDGITLTFEDNPDINIRLSIACNAMMLRLDLLQYSLGDDRRDLISSSPAYRKILGEGFRTFYSHDGFRLCLPYTAVFPIQGRITSFLNTLLHTKPEHRSSLTYPRFDTHIPVLDFKELGADENNQIFIPYDDFIIDDFVSYSNMQSRQAAYSNTVLNTLRQKYAEHPEWTSTTPYTYDQFEAWFSGHTRKAAVNSKNGYITHPKRNEYYFNFIDLIEKEKTQNENTSITGEVEVEAAPEDDSI